MFAGLGVDALLGLAQVPKCGPRVRGAGWHEPVPEVPGCRPAVRSCEAELRRRLVVEAGRGLVRFAHPAAASRA